MIWAAVRGSIVFVERQWIRYVAGSVLFHAVILLIPLHTEKTRRIDAIEVVMTDESPFVKSGRQGGSPGRSGRHGSTANTSRPESAIGSGSKAMPVKAKDESSPTPVSSVSHNETLAGNEGQRTAKSSEDGVAVAAKGSGGSGGGDGTVHGDAQGKGGRGSGTGGGGLGGGYGPGIGEAGFNSPAGPRFLHREIPEYPLLARRRKKEGKVVLMVTIDEHGRLVDVEVVEASHPLFVEPSIEAVKKSTFLPATRNGTPIAVRAMLPIRFSLRDS